MSTITYLLIIFNLVNTLTAPDFSHTVRPVEYYGIKDNSHVFIVRHDSADSIGISFNNREEIIAQRQVHHQAFRIRLTNLRDGLHKLKINYYKDSKKLDRQVFPVFKHGDIISLQRHFLWISRFDFINLVPSNSLENQSDYNNHKKAILDNMLFNASVSGITDILFQVRGQGDVLYKSKIEPYSHLLFLDRTVSDCPGWDPLQFVMDKCLEYNLQLHLWINVFPISFQNSRFPVKSIDSIILPQDRESIQTMIAVNMDGNRPKRDGYIYLHPAHQMVPEYIKSILTELIKNYEFDGIHFDYFRLDEARYIYNKEVMTRYDLYKDKMAFNDFIQYKINENLKIYHKLIKRHNPYLKISCAVIGKLKGDGFSAYNQFQDPVKWIQDGHLDLIFPMTYFFPNSLEHLNDYLTEIKSPFHNRIIPGIGAYLVMDRTRNLSFSYISNAYKAFNNAGNIGGTAFFSAEVLVRGNYWNSLRGMLLAIDQ